VTKYRATSHHHPLAQSRVFPVAAAAPHNEILDRQVTYEVLMKKKMRSAHVVSTNVGVPFQDADHPAGVRPGG
jgi:hypothetical protein